MDSAKTPDQVRERLDEDLANGKTIVLSSRELDDPSLREQLPQLLEDLSRKHQQHAGIGPRIRGYTMLGEIGQGGMSTVYLARQEKLGRHVAVKIAPKWLGGGERARRMLVQEAQAMARLAHPNIVVIHDIIDVDDTFAIAMEWIDGRTLASLLRTLPDAPSPDDMTLLCTALGTTREQRAGIEDTAVRYFVRLVRDVALAAQAVHDADLLHLDIKPSNVLIRRDGTPLLADFGVTREISPELTQTRTFAGTPVYAAPEQLHRDDDQIGPRSDVYSLGVTLYEALARVQPLRGLDLPGILQCVESGSMPPLSSKVAVPPDLENIVHRAIAPEPEHRYPSAQEFADDLDAFLQHRPVKARPLSRTQRLRRWMRNEPWKAALAASLLVLIPALAVLATYLALQLPVIVRAEEQRRLARANQIKQATLQRYFTNEISTDAAVARLREAQQLDPGDTTFACLVTIGNESGWWRAAELLDRRPDGVDRSLGLQLAARKAAERRSFFTAEEVAALDQSERLVDHYVLALDRVFRAEDNPSERNCREALDALDEVSRRTAPDPLLFGLHAWFSTRCLERRRFPAAARAIWRNWPDDPVVQAWHALAIEPFDAEQSLRTCREIIDRTPNEPRGHEILVGALLRADRNDEALEALRAAEALGLRSEGLDALHVDAQARAGDAAAIDLLVAHAKQGRFSVSKQIRTLREFRADDVRPHLDMILAAPHPEPAVYEEAYLFAREDVALADQIWPRYRERFPDRCRLHARRLLYLLRERDMEAIAGLGRELSLRRGFADAIAGRLTRGFVQVRDWRELRRIGEEWVELGEDPEQASFYAGMACLRMAEYDAASMHLGRAVRRPTPGKTWFASALLEVAWLHAAPEAPAALRNPERARFHLGEFERHRTQSTFVGPWTWLVRGEVHFINGERDEAARCVDQGLRPGRREHQAPADVRERLLDLQRRLK